MRGGEREGDRQIERERARARKRLCGQCERDRACQVDTVLSWAGMPDESLGSRAAGRPTQGG